MFGQEHTLQAVLLQCWHAKLQMVRSLLIAVFQAKHVRAGTHPTSCSFTDWRSLIFEAIRTSPQDYEDKCALLCNINFL